ncbi:hypothetical protein H0H93_016003 [Arthromyces matolae]|nr:hypothetical protein H0H93_016003 [Arthromyces matolae]
MAEFLTAEWLEIIVPSSSPIVTCFSSPKERNTVFACIQDEISSLSDRILELKMRQNAINITARLPTEVLQRVFTSLVSLIDPETLESKRGLAWIHVAGVCKSWRLTALECSHLWSFILHPQPDWITEVILPRSGQAPLYISVDLKETRNFTGMQRAVDRIDQVRKLSLERRVPNTPIPSKSDEVQKLLLSLASNPAPLLEELILSFSCSKSSIYRLPPNVFLDVAPRLWNLKLVHCILPQNSAILSRITHLEFEGNGFPTLALSRLLEILRSASQLETLTLVDPCHIPSDLEEMNVLHHETVYLPRLKCLTLSSAIFLIDIILSLIEMPTATRLLIAIESSPHNTSTCAALAKRLSTWITSIHYLYIQDSYFVEAHHCLSSNSKFFRIKTTHPLLEMFLMDLCLLDLRMLRLEGTGISSASLVQLFGQLPALKSIEFSDDTPAIKQALLTGVSHEEMMEAVTTGDDKWVEVDTLNKARSSRTHDRSMMQPHSVLADSAQASNSYGGYYFTNDIFRCNGFVKNASDEKILLTLRLGQGSVPLQFASLKKLKVIRWLERMTNSEHREIDPTTVIAILHLRKIRGYPLDELSMENCGQFRRYRDLDAIRKFVKSVTVDPYPDGDGTGLFCCDNIHGALFTNS